MVEGFVQRHVVFIDEEHGFLPIMLIEQKRKRLEAVEDVVLRILLLQDSLQRLFVVPGDPLAFEQHPHPRNFGTYEQPQHAIGILERQPIHALEREEHHGKLPHIRFAQRRFFRDRQPVEQRLIRAGLQKAFQHAHVQRLAKAPRPGEQVHFSPVVQKIPDQPCFIDIIKIFPAQLFKAVNPHRQLLSIHTATPLSPAAVGIPNPHFYFTAKPAPYQAAAPKITKSPSRYARTPHREGLLCNWCKPGTLQK